MRWAAPKLQRECISHMTSIFAPTARRILSKGSRPVLRSDAEMNLPSVAAAKGSKGQIFIAVKPSSTKLWANSSARVMKAI